MNKQDLCNGYILQDKASLLPEQRKPVKSCESDDVGMSPSQKRKQVLCWAEAFRSHLVNCSSVGSQGLTKQRQEAIVSFPDLLLKTGPSFQTRSHAGFSGAPCLRTFARPLLARPFSQILHCPGEQVLTHAVKLLILNTTYSSCCTSHSSHETQGHTYRIAYVPSSQHAASSTDIIASGPHMTSPSQPQLPALLSPFPKEAHFRPRNLKEDSHSPSLYLTLSHTFEVILFILCFIACHPGI